LSDFKLELVAWVTGMLLFVLSPLLVFVPLLARIKRVGLVEYGELAQRYVREFDQKWLRGGAPAGEALVGGDIQSLAEFGNSFEIVKGMKPVPFGRDTVLQLAFFSLAPVVPLILTTIPLGQQIHDRVGGRLGFDQLPPDKALESQGQGLHGTADPHQRCEISNPIAAGPQGCPGFLAESPDAALAG